MSHLPKFSDKTPHQEYIDRLPPQVKFPFLNWFIDNPIATNLLMFAIVFGGLWQASQLRLEVFDIPPMQVSIRTTVEDATPSQVANEVSERIENTISDVPGIEAYYSVSSGNFSIVNVFASNGTTVTDLAENLGKKIKNISLPGYAEEPEVSEGKWSVDLAWVSLMGEVSEATMKKYAIKLKDKLQNDKNITRIEFRGLRDSELQISIDKDKMLKHQLSFALISNMISQAVGDKAIGRIESGSGKISVQIRGKEDTVEDYREIVVKRGTDGYLLKLGDVATIEPALTGEKRLSLMNGKTSVTLRIISEGKVNVVDAYESAEKIIESFKSETLPVTMDALIWNNRSELIVERLDLFKSSGLSAIFLVLLLLALFLSPKLGFWVALGVPISICGAFIMMGIMDISISMISLFGFILVLGILVDDAIVIGESIYSQKIQTENSPDATIMGLSRVSTAATFGVLTTVAAFVPLVSIDGFIGKILSDLSYVVIFCLLFSLVESKLILPSHLRHIYVPLKHEKRNVFTRFQQRIASTLEWFVFHVYKPVLRIALRYRYFSLCVFLSIFIFSLAALKSGIVGLQGGPDIESDDLSVAISMRSDVTVKRTHEVARKVSSALVSMNVSFRDSHKIDYDVVSNVSTTATDYHIRLKAELASVTVRKIPASEISERWQNAVGEIEGAEKSSFSGRRRSGQADIEVQLKSQSRKSLSLASAYIQDTLKSVQGLTNVHDSESDEGQEIFEIVLNEKAALYGINELSLAKEIRGAYFGYTVKKIYQDGEEVPVIIRLDSQDELTLADLYEQNVMGANGEPIPVREVATLEKTEQPESIYRLDGELSFIVSADVKGEMHPSDVIKELEGEGFFDEVRRRFDVSVNLGGEAEQDRKSDESLLEGFYISMALIFALLAIPLKSFVQPFIIMLAIPFGIVGAIWGHYIMGMNMTTISFFGVLALSGVVVNDSLVFVSTAHQYRSEGYNMTEALERTGMRRFRPILLTSLTTFLGLLPLFYEKSIQAQFLIPMGVSLGYGILFATMITLILIPVVYYIGFDVANLFRRLRKEEV